MKFFIAVSVALFASVSANPAGIVNTGASAVSRSDDGHGNYAFGYNEDHATGGTFRKEKGGPGYQSGSYGLRDADGRIRTVNYVADALGYRASIQTNEPGVDPHQAPAAASVNGAVAAVPALHAEPIYAEKAGLALAAPAYAAAGPYGLGKAGYGEPLLAAGPAYAGIPSAYSVATQHVSAAPALLAAPAYGAPLAYGKGLAAPYGAPLLNAGYAGKYDY